MLGAAGVLSVPTSARGMAEEPVVTNIGHFQIPFDVETEPGQAVQGYAVLFGSQDAGSRWDRLQSVPAAQSVFMFAAPRDGRYSFAIRMTDLQGNVQAPAANSPPELDVIVDTIAPDLKLELFESGASQPVVNWTCTDTSAVPESLVIEFAEGGNGRWKPLQMRPSANGQTLIPVTAGSVVAVRASISDLAGNRVEATSQIVSPGGAIAANNGATAAPQQYRPAALGPSPFSPPASSQPRKANPPVKPTTSPGATASLPTPGSAVPAAGAPFTAPPLTMPATVPMNPAQPPIAGFTNANGYPAPKEAQAVVDPAKPQIVNVHIFDVDYQVEDVGPSGVGAVELFVTENDGQEWFRYGNDADLKSPFHVDVRGEGTFGFAVRVRNGLGFVDAPPQPGQVPEIAVTVDGSAPVIEFSQPTLRADGFGTMDLAWQVSDAHPHATPVRLEYSTTPAGPWTPVFDWQINHNGYQWAIRPGIPSSLYFRLLARDEAGNIGTAQTPQPVIVDLIKPIGRLLRVQAVSHSAAVK